MKKCMIQFYRVVSWGVEWTDGYFAVVKTKNLRVDPDGKTHGRPFTVYDVEIVNEDGSLGDTLESFDTFKEARAWAEQQ